MNSSGGKDSANSMFPVIPEFNTLAYVKPVTTEKGRVYGVFSGDGTRLAVFDSFDAAFYAAKQHDLEPMPIH